MKQNLRDLPSPLFFSQARPPSREFDKKTQGPPYRGFHQGSLKTRIDLLYSSSPLAYIKLIKNKIFLCFSKRAIFGEKLYQGNYFVVTWQSIRSLQWSLVSSTCIFIELIVYFNHYILNDTTAMISTFFTFTFTRLMCCVRQEVLDLV